MLLPAAGSIADADARLAAAGRARATAAALVPPEWADGAPYAEFLDARGSKAPREWAEEADACPRDERQFQYAALRVVPRVERGEAVNAGVVLFCRPLRFLGARTQLDEALLAALSPRCDPTEVTAQLQTIERIAAGEPAGRRRSPRCPRPSASTGSSRPRARSSSPARSTPGSRATRKTSSTGCSPSSWNADATFRRRQRSLRGT